MHQYCKHLIRVTSNSDELLERCGLINMLPWENTRYMGPDVAGVKRTSIAAAKASFLRFGKRLQFQMNVLLQMKNPYSFRKIVQVHLLVRISTQCEKSTCTAVPVFLLLTVLLTVLAKLEFFT